MDHAIPAQSDRILSQNCNGFKKYSPVIQILRDTYNGVT
jgi:hypothetical protein